MTLIDSIQEDRINYIYNTIGDYKIFQELMDFGISYMEMNPDWDNIINLLPPSLTAEQSDIFIKFAVSIDKVAKPVYNCLTRPSRVNPTLDEDAAICKHLLAARLATLGLAIKVEVFLDIVAEGRLTELEAVATGAQLLEIWLQYEACNMRIH